MSSEQSAIASPAASINAHLWVANYADYLYGYAITRLNDEELARDLVQETFLAALESIAGFQGKSTEKTWLTAILKNKIVDVYRSRYSGRITRPLPLTAEREQDNFFEPEDGHWNEAHRPQDFLSGESDPLHNKELQQVLKACMDKLPALWYAVFTMKHLDEEQTETICSSLSVSASNFWVIMHRAKVNLRACLQKKWH